MVEYTVIDKDSGYVAKVSYQGVARGDNPHHRLPKGIKREIPAGSFAHPVKIKPYGRNIEPHTLQVSNFYTMIIPNDIENETVIPSPEIVTVASVFDLNTDPSSQGKHHESDSTW
jgi:hypothetical protein